MLSVIVATNESERTLVPTLSALVPGALSGLVTEVVVADAGSKDATAEVADIAGCRFMIVEGAIGPRLKELDLIFVGIDVIGDYLTEINVTSPTGIREIKRFGGPDIAPLIWDAIEKRRG